MRRWVAVVLAVSSSSMLCGCIAASIAANIAAATALTNAKKRAFVNANTEVAFDSEDIAPLPRGPVAVWPRDEVQVGLAARLKAEIGPDKVSAILYEAKTPETLEGVGVAELSGRFKVVCEKSGGAVVVAGRPSGAQRAEVFSYVCGRNELITERMTVRGVPGMEFNDLIIATWAERIEAAQALGAQASAN